MLGVGIFLSTFASQKLTSGNFKRFYTISLIIYAIAYIGYSVSSNIYIFYILSLFVGFGFMSTTIIPVSVLINNWFQYKRGLALSLALSGLGIGGVIFSQFVTFIINNFGWQQAYMSYGVLMLLIVLPVILFLIKVKPEDIGLKPYGVGIEIDEKPGEKEQEQMIDLTFSETTTKPFFILLVGGAALVGIANNGGLG